MKFELYTVKKKRESYCELFKRWRLTRKQKADQKKRSSHFMLDNCIVSPVYQGNDNNGRAITKRGEILYTFTEASQKKVWNYFKIEIANCKSANR